MSSTTKTNNATARETVVGVYHSHAEAQNAVHELKAAGFTDDQIGVAARDIDGTYSEQVDDTMAPEGAAAGAATGLGIGALWGLGIAAGILPAIGPVIAGGTLAAIAASAAGTAAAGGLIGALVGSGIPEDEADYYQTEFENGRTIVTVKSGTADYQKASQILDGYNAYDYDRRESDYAADVTAAKRMDLSGKMVARKEIADVNKTMHKTGEARVRKEVHTETKTIEVPVKREELVVERTNLNEQEVGSIKDRSGSEERITLREEQVDISKRTVAKEAVSVGKRKVTDTKNVDVELTEEEIVVDRDVKNRK